MGPITMCFSFGFNDDFLLWTFSLGSWKILVFRCQGIVIIQTRLISMINCWNGQ
jgi:hypothetical protein